MKRKARPMPKEHKELDLTIPIKAHQLGSEDDPCFGRGYSLSAAECKRCGDYESCAIVTQQRKMPMQIGKQESLAKFKDVEEAELMNSQNARIATIMYNRAKKKKGNWCSIEKLLPKLREILNLLAKEDLNIKQRCIIAAESKGLTLNKAQTKYKL